MADSTDIGPIQVSVNGRYFLDQNGDPFFWLGDTQWELFRSFSLEETELILDDRARKGFTVIQVMITGVGDGTKPNLIGQTPWLNNDPGNPNEGYFRNVDTILQSGCQKGLIFVLGVYHQVQTAHITPANARGYAKWIADRFRNVPNIIWTMYPKAEQEFVPVLRELAIGLREGDGGAHIITVHPDPAPASSSFIHNESWLAANMIQTWSRYDLIWDMVTHDYNLTPTKPVVMAEGAYEAGSEYGFPVTPLMVRKQAYLSYLSGGHHSYGHNDCWRMLPTWVSALDAPGAVQLGILKNLFTARRWWDLVPDQSIFADQDRPDPSLVTAARSCRGDWIIIYLGSPAAVSINMAMITASGTTEASWVDPVSGEQTRIGAFPNTGERSFSTPDGWEDAVLLIEAVAL